VVGRQNADTADTLHLRDVALATTFWLSILGVCFGVKLSDEDIAVFEVLRDVAMLTVLAFYIWGALDATSRIRLDRPCAAAMQPYVKLL